MSWINNLKQIMSDKGVNIEILKNKIVENGHSLSRNSIGNILNERNSPKLDTMQIIADALDVRLDELFVDGDRRVNATSTTEVDGFIDFDGEIYRVKSKEDFKELYKRIFNGEPVLSVPVEAKKENTGEVYNGQSLLARTKTRRNVNKLQRHVYQRFNVTVSNRRELESPNNLPKDIRFWVFRSRHEELKAKNILQKSLKFSFNE